jgi:hypothetical protein
MTKNMKKCSTSVAMKEMQIKTMLRFLFTCVRMAAIKKANRKFWQGSREKESSNTAGQKLN